MKTRPAGIVVALGVAVASFLVIWLSFSDRITHVDRDEVIAPSSPAPTSQRVNPPAEARAPIPDAGPSPKRAHPSERVSAKWGSGPGELGRARPQEGNPEAPMSLAVAPDGSLVVLDQVNARLVRFKDGQATSMSLSQRAPQDLAIAHDGTVAVLDRLGDRDVALYAPDGTALGTLPLAGAGLPDTGAVTGLFTDGDQLYAEREHGQLVHLGDTRGNPAPTRDELQGRPTRDGRYTLFAGIIDRKAGRIFLAENARPSGQNRFTRELDLPRPPLSLMLLDSDQRGTVYLAALLGDDGMPPEVALMCSSEESGQLLGDVSLPANLGAEETMRDLTALDSGGVLYAERSEQGVSYRFVSCP